MVRPLKGFSNLIVGYCGKLEGNMVLWSAQILKYVEVRTIPLNLEKGEKSRAVRRYADITREDVQTPLEKNRLIIH